MIRRALIAVVGLAAAGCISPPQLEPIAFDVGVVADMALADMADDGMAPIDMAAADTDIASDMASADGAGFDGEADAAPDMARAMDAGADADMGVGSDMAVEPCAMGCFGAPQTVFESAFALGRVELAGREDAIGLVWDDGPAVRYAVHGVAGEQRVAPTRIAEDGFEGGARSDPVVAAGPAGFAAVYRDAQDGMGNRARHTFRSLGAADAVVGEAVPLGESSYAPGALAHRGDAWFFVGSGVGGLRVARIPADEQPSSGNWSDPQLFSDFGRPSMVFARGLWQVAYSARVGEGLRALRLVAFDAVFAPQGNPETLTEADGDLVDPQLAFEPLSEALYVAWAAPGDGVWIQRRAAADLMPFAEAVPVGTPAAEQPALVLFGEGPALAFVDGGPAGRAVHLLRFDAELNPLGPAVRLSADDRSARDPRLALVGERLAVAWIAQTAAQDQQVRLTVSGPLP